jgi:hypothetical protein
MSRPLLLAVLIVSGCGSDFEVPALPDARVQLDLAVAPPVIPPDMACFNMACGACSNWKNWDGTPSKVGDPCGYKGTYACNGMSLACNSTACPTCSTGGRTPAGTVCGADGHTIVELTYVGSTCSAYDLGSAIGVCNHGAADKCQHRCTLNGSVYDCVAHCASDDGGGTGCDHSATETCESLAGC